MSFFIKGKQVNGFKRAKFSKEKRKKGKPIKENNKDDEITSSENDSDNNENERELEISEDENETAQDKKLRLAKVYLEEIEKLERARREDKEIEKDDISKRVNVDYLKQTGKYRSLIAKHYTNYDTQNIKILKCKEQQNTITCSCISADDKYLFSGSKDGIVVKWSLTDYKKLGVIPFVKKSTSDKIVGHSNKITALEVSFDNKFLVVGEDSNDIQIWSLESLEHIKSLKGHRNSITGLSFKKDSYTLFSCSRDKSVKVWNLDEMSYVETLFGHQDIITSIHSLYRDRVVTSGGRDSTLRIWKISEESQLIFNGHSGSIDVVKLINEENFISGGDDGHLCIWSTMKKKPLCSVAQAHDCDPLNNQPFWICSLAALVNTDLVASGSSNGLIKVWKLGDNFRTIDLIFSIPIQGFINSLGFTSDGKKLIASCGKDHRYGRWSIIKSAKNSVIIIPLLIEN